VSSRANQDPAWRGCRRPFFTPLRVVTYVADGKETDGNPSLRYLSLLREGARAHGLPKHYIRYLESVKHAE
jgi:hypothetical protein